MVHLIGGKNCINAAKNIRNRVLVTVLQKSLLKQFDNGTFEPKKIKREKVKESIVIVSGELARVCKE